jgi:hypothetical protein
MHSDDEPVGRILNRRNALAPAPGLALMIRASLTSL